MADEAGVMERPARPVRRVADRPQQALQHLAGVYTNGAEEFFSRMRRAEIGHHHHIAGAYLVRYAQEAPGARTIGGWTTGGQVTAGGRTGHGRRPRRLIGAGIGNAA